MKRIVFTILILAIAINFIYPARSKHKKPSTTKVKRVVHSKNLKDTRIVKENEEERFLKIYKYNKDRILLLKTREGTGSGFISEEGFIITANHVLGSSPYIEMSFNNIVYILKPCYRNHEEDIAILYPAGFMNSFNFMQNVDYDFFKNKSYLQLKDIDLKPDESILLLGYPYGLQEVKRITGKYKETKIKYKGNISLFACDLPVIRGCSGGPVFNLKGEMIGTAVSFETEPTYTEYLVSYVTPNSNIINTLKKINKEYIEELKSISEKIPSFSIEEKNIKTLNTNFWKFDNIGIESGKGFYYIYNKDSDGGLIYEDRSIDSVNFYFDIFITSIEETKNNNCYFELIIKKNDEKNYISFVLDLNNGEYFIKYVTNGNTTKKDAIIKMSVLPKSIYNIEVYTKGNKMGIYFDNMPVYYDLELPISRGYAGFEFGGIGRMYIYNFLLRIPK